MSARRARLRHAPPGPNMTPMVDVVLVILIFFMAAMGIAVREQYLRTGVPPKKDSEPAGAAAAAQQPKPAGGEPAPKAVLRMTRDSGRTVVSGLGMERAPLGDMTARLKDLKTAGMAEGVIVVVAPAGDVPYQDVVIMHDACEGANIGNVRLGVIGR